MELRLFGRAKELRLVRPKRVATLEWIRAVRHNLFCEWTLLADEARQKVSIKIKQWQNISLTELVSQWPEKLRHLISGRRAAEGFKGAYTRLRTRGIGPAFWPFIFVIGLLLGIGAKWGAENHLTIGYEDYTLAPANELYDLNALAKKLATGLPENPNPRKEYPACTLQQP